MRRNRNRVGTVFHQPLERPIGVNPMRDPLVWSDVLRKGLARYRLRARDRREFEPVDVREFRRLFGQTRGQFASMMGISQKTLRNWERGRRYPVGPSRALLRSGKFWALLTHAAPPLRLPQLGVVICQTWASEPRGEPLAHSGVRWPNPKKRRTAATVPRRWKPEEASAMASRLRFGNRAGPEAGRQQLITRMREIWNAPPTELLRPQRTGRGRADEHLIVFVGDRHSRPPRQPPVAVEPPQQRVRIEEETHGYSDQRSSSSSGSGSKNAGRRVNRVGLGRHASSRPL